MPEPISPVLPGLKYDETILGPGDTNAMPLPVYHNAQGYLSRWHFTATEKDWINKHGCIYVHVAGAAHPPIDLIAEAVGLRPDGMVCTMANTYTDPLERLAQIKSKIDCFICA